ncbi:MAG: hypothetical protein U1E17_21235 [Geminicoccaceae bacterium]
MPIAAAEVLRRAWASWQQAQTSAEIVAHVRHRRRHLHRRVHEVRAPVGSLDHVRRAGERRLDVAVHAADLARLLRRRLELLLIAHRFVDRVRPQLPLDLELLAALVGGPGVGRDHRQPAQRLEFERLLGAGDLDHLLDARHLERLAGVVAFDGAEQDRAALHRGVLHARQAHVDAEGGPAVGDVGHVHDRHGLADVAPLLARLELDLVRGRHRQLDRRRHQLPIVQRLVGLEIDDLVVARLAVGGIDAPGLGCRLLEHGAGGGAELAQPVEILDHAARAVGVLVAELLVALGLDHGDPGPVGL